MSTGDWELFSSYVLSNQSWPFVEFAILYAYQIVANVEEIFPPVRSAFALRLYHSYHFQGRHHFFFRTFFHNYCEISQDFFFPGTGQGFGCSSRICGPSATPFRPKNREKPNFFEIGQLYVRSQILREKCVGDVQFQIKSKNRGKKWIGDR